MAHDVDASSDGGLVRLPTPPSTHLLLAVHHDRYAQLLRTFLAWKRRAQTQCVRRRRTAAACRVGATFYQQIFWERWRAFVDHRRQHQQETAAQSKEEETHEEQPPEEQASDGIELGTSTERRSENVAVSGTYDDEQEDDSKYGKQDDAILLRKRHLFKRWKLSLEDKAKTSPDRVTAVVRIRSLHAIRRWRDFVRLRRDRSDLQQRAYFFLYYWLLKRSLNRLGRHSLIKKRERTLIVKIMKANRHHLLVNAMQRWRLRLRMHQSLVLWWSYVQRRRHQKLLYRPIADALARKTQWRLLRLTFDAWGKQHTRNQAQLMLLHVIDRHVYRKVCARAWGTWKIHVQQLMDLDTFQRGYQERRLRWVWEVWSAKTREQEYREQQRRCAVRAYYLSLLRKGFDGFRTWRIQRQVALNRVQTMQDAADARIMASAFLRWDHFTGARKLQALKFERAVLHSDSRVLKRIWLKGFRCFFSNTIEKKRLLLAAQEHHYVRTIRRSFCMWKDVWRAEHNREQTYTKMLQGFKVAKERAVKARVLESWSEFTRAKAARRVVNAQVRGEAQRRMLQKYLAQWVTYVSLLRWQLITCTRADQHYRSIILKKCLERWRSNIVLRQRYRNKTRTALVHWKLTLERKAFDGWKQYLHAKRMKQHRIHEALEFRHQEFIRDGLRHWMTGALHLQEQREQRVALAQASNTTNVWRRVAAIARHWRYLTIRRRAISEEGRMLDRSRNIPRRVQDDESWRVGYQQIERVQHKKMSAPGARQGRAFKEISTFPDDARSSNWAMERSPLSEFVLLPRNRPQPRRPVEVLLFSQVEADNLPRPSESAGMHENLRCGFEFPAEPFAPLNPPPEYDVKPISPTWKFPPSPSTAVRERRRHRDLPAHTSAMPPRECGDLLLPRTTAAQLDALEQQLVALIHRKKEWKVSQQQLEALREEAASNPRLQVKLHMMEKQHADRTKQWSHTKTRIRSLASEIQQLRSALRR